MRTLLIASLVLHLDVESDGVRVRTLDESVILPEQTIQAVEALLRRNFDAVKEMLKDRAARNLLRPIDDARLDRLSIEIVLHYLYMYNMWRIKYRRKAYDNLDFKQSDFSSTDTDDFIISFCKRFYPSYWQEYGQALLDYDDREKFLEYCRRREAFFNSM